MAQRKIDVVLDSVRRLQRLGATANLVNLLHKQHPADLAQVFAELGEKDRASSFALLVERNSKLAMEALSELGPERGAALLADRSAEDVARPGLSGELWTVPLLTGDLPGGSSARAMPMQASIAMKSNRGIGPIVISTLAVERGLNVLRRTHHPSRRSPGARTTPGFIAVSRPL